MYSANEAVKFIRSGDRVYIHGSAATPSTLLKALCNAPAELRNVELIAVSTLGALDLTKPEFAGRFYFNSLFVSENIRGAVNSERGDYIPIF
jgi:acyl-CoA hydrolase